MPSRDSILGCAALLKDAEQRAAFAFTEWTKANVRFQAMLDRPFDAPLPGQVALEAARLDAVATYEALLDGQRLKHDLRIRLIRLKAVNDRKRLPPPGKPGEAA